MPKQAKRPCKQPGCPNVTSGRYCSDHTTQVHTYDQHRPSAAKRGYGYRWRKLRRMVLARSPLCADPFETHTGRAVQATDVDHIIPLAQGGTNAMDNLQSLCHSCHSRKTVEMDGGLGRGIKSLQPENARPAGWLSSHTREIE